MKTYARLKGDVTPSETIRPGIGPRRGIVSLLFRVCFALISRELDLSRGCLEAGKYLTGKFACYAVLAV